MKRVNLPRYDVTRFDSRGVQMLGAAMLDEPSQLRVHIATLAPGAVLGRHRATLRQQFTVLDGAGWVETDGIRDEIVAGQTVEWQVGEMHESGSRDGMRVLIIECDAAGFGGDSG